MPTETYIEENSITGLRNLLPSVSIIEPFQPMMSSKSDIECRLKLAIEKAEKKLMAKYPMEKTLPVIIKLHNLVHNLNYNTHKKSIAIFASPVIEKTYYFDISVEERIVTDEFKIRDIICSKKQNTEYLVFLLSAECSKMYLGNNEKLTLIKSNVPENIAAYKNDIPERVSNFSDPDKRKEILLDKFLHHMDEGLSLVLKAYNLPVFVMGAEKVLGHFKKITHNADMLVEFIHGSYTDASEAQTQEILKPYLQDWKNIKQQNILLELAKATDYEKVAYGMEEVLESRPA